MHLAGKLGILGTPEFDFLREIRRSLLYIEEKFCKKQWDCE